MYVIIIIPSFLPSLLFSDYFHKESRLSLSFFSTDVIWRRYIVPTATDTDIDDDCYYYENAAEKRRNIGIFSNNKFIGWIFMIWSEVSSWIKPDDMIWMDGYWISHKNILF